MTEDVAAILAHVSPLEAADLIRRGRVAVTDALRARAAELGKPKRKPERSPLMDRTMVVRPPVADTRATKRFDRAQWAAAWRIVNRDHVNAIARERRWRDPEKMRARDRAFYARNREQINARRRGRAANRRRSSADGAQPVGRARTFTQGNGLTRKCNLQQTAA